jgi:hypothetical protein
MTKRQEFVGCLFDVISETVVEVGVVIRGTYAEAMADARSMVEPFNEYAQGIDDEADNDSTVGRVDETYCFVQVDGQVVYSEQEVAA